MNNRTQALLESLAPRAFFKALCDPNRLKLFVNLCCCQNPSTIGEASRCCPTDPSVSSRHISILRDAGLVTCVKRGKEVFVQANTSLIVATLRSLADALEKCCGATCGIACVSEKAAPATPDSSRSKAKPHRRKK